MIEIRERILAGYKFFHITESDESLELNGIADAVMSIVIGYSESVWPE